MFGLQLDFMKGNVMNDHIRAVKRLAQIVTLPIIIGLAVALIFEYFPVQTIITMIAIGTAIFMLYLVYSWILYDIRARDKIESMFKKNLTE